MRKALIIFAMILVSDFAKSACNSPISRTNFSANQVLTSTRLNTELNTVYSRTNELPGDCITDETVTSAKIVNGTITNADISNTAAISRTKLGAPNTQTSTGSSGNFSTTSTTAVDVTNMTVTLTTTGNPVELSLIHDGTTNSSDVGSSSANPVTQSYVQIVRGATVVCLYTVRTQVASGATSISTPSSAVKCIDNAPAGVNVYKVQAYAISGSTAFVDYAKLFAREL